MSQPSHPASNVANVADAVRPGAGARRPAGARGLPLGAGRRRGPAEHQRVAVPAAGRLADGAGRRAGVDRVAPLPRSRGRRRCARRSPTGTASRPEQVFAANGSNEVLQTLLLTYAGPGRIGAHVRADLPAARPHRPDHRRHGRRGRAGAPTSRSTRRWPRRVVAAAQPAVTFLCSPNNPTGLVEEPAMVRPLLDVGARPGRRRRGLRPVRRLDGARPRRARTCRWRSCARSPRRGAWRPPASATSSGRRGWSPPREGRAAVPPRRRQAGRRPPRPRPRRRDGRAGQADRRRARAARRGARPRCPSTSFPSGANFVLFRVAPAARARRCGRASSTAACSCATARAGRGSTTACGSRSARRPRTTASSPPSTTVLA